MQGAFKMGLYEVFKDLYSNMLGEENTKKYKPLIWCAGSASAEVFADIVCCHTNSYLLNYAHTSVGCGSNISNYRHFVHSRW